MKDHTDGRLNVRELEAGIERMKKDGRLADSFSLRDVCGAWAWGSDGTEVVVWTHRAAYKAVDGNTDGFVYIDDDGEMEFRRGRRLVPVVKYMYWLD